MAKMKRLWLRNHKKVKMRIRLKLYNSLVKSILLYNSSTWGLTKKDEDQLDSFHRQQLRRVLHITYPHKIGCKKLCRITKSRPISCDITRSRWRMFGHCLRMDSNTPARRAMQYYFTENNEKRFLGQRRATLVTTINRDIKDTLLKFPDFEISILKTENDLQRIQILAGNRKSWRNLVKKICNTAQANKSTKFNFLE